MQNERFTRVTTNFASSSATFRRSRRIVLLAVFNYADEATGSFIRVKPGSLTPASAGKG
jgi:hypothetical protein